MAKSRLQSSPIEPMHFFPFFLYHLSLVPAVPFYWPSSLLTLSMFPRNIALASCAHLIYFGSSPVPTLKFHLLSNSSFNSFTLSVSLARPRAEGTIQSMAPMISENNPDQEGACGRDSGPGAVPGPVAMAVFREGRLTPTPRSVPPCGSFKNLPLGSSIAVGPALPKRLQPQLSASRQIWLVEVRPSRTSRENGSGDGLERRTCRGGGISRIWGDLRGRLPPCSRLRMPHRPPPVQIQPAPPGPGSTSPL